MTNIIQTELFTLFRGEHREAEYGECINPHYKGYPTIEALPPILSENEASRQLMRFPAYYDQLRQAPNHERFHIIQGGLRFYMPLPETIRIHEGLSMAIRGGYLGRNPAKPDFQANIRSGLSSLNFTPDDTDEGYSTASGFSVIGMSGVGKSKTIEANLKLYPQVIHHSEYNNQPFTKTQVIWLKLECPFDGSPRAVCVNFFRALSAIVKTDYTKQYASERRSAVVMMPDMANLAYQLNLGVLVIDEIQRLSNSKIGNAQQMLDFFVQLINEIGVPVVLVGTSKALNILSAKFSQIRRGTGSVGEVIMERMKEDKEWHIFSKALWKYQYTHQVCPLTPTLAHALYDASQGIHDFAVKIYMLAQLRAIKSGLEIISPDIIYSVADDSLKLASPILKAFRENDRSVLERYEDLPDIDFNAIVQETINQRIIIAPLSEEELTDASEIDFAALNEGTAQENAPDELSKDSPQKTPTKDPAGQVSANTRPTKLRRKGALKPLTRSTRGELPRIVAELEAKYGWAAYESLKHTKFIRSVDEFF